MSDTFWIDASVQEGFPQSLQKKMGMGTPQVRWREMHQSERSRIMETIRSLPHSGFHWMLSQASTAASLMASTLANHC